MYIFYKKLKLKDLNKLNLRIKRTFNKDNVSFQNSKTVRTYTIELFSLRA